MDDLLQVLTFSVAQTESVPTDYFQTMADLAEALQSPSEIYYAAVTAPLKSESNYAGFAESYLTFPQNEEHLDKIAPHLNSAALVRATGHAADRVVSDIRRSLWLLGQFLYVTEICGNTQSESSIWRLTNIHIVATLMASVADVIAGSPDSPSAELGNRDYDKQYLSKFSTQSVSITLNRFLQQQFVRLVDQQAVRSLLASSPQNGIGADAGGLLAGYALTLLRVFPRRADDIRMWLYLGPPGSDGAPIIAWFWKKTEATEAYQAIKDEPRAVIDLLKPKRASMPAWQPPNAILPGFQQRDDQWRVILVFLELYTFVIKLMDDEEFLRESRGTARLNPLEKSQIRDLTIFLKNMGFTMYFNSTDITSFGDLAGISVDYVKGLVTGLLRSIYERDSRRHFLPKGHWLMTSRLDMSNFISAVVAEEESRKQLQDQDEDDDQMGSDSDEEWYASAHRTTREAHMREKRLRAQRHASKKRYLQSVAPRLEILQNMPFFIPFETRVQIFREFIHLDQEKRRNGYVEPDLWRQSMMFQRDGSGERELARHHAKIRRKHEFEDALEEFYSLGEALKEPIQITFVDEFDIVEAGIDGGGVTKEFLTSTTSQAFHPERGLFTTNEKHLLYPNPTMVEETKALFHGNREALARLAQEYEFAGRIIGKCMYEGILVDVTFAPFFLLKWALTGGEGAASGETSYRANINDLRDLDEQLYAGLLYIKNYPGNVEEDFSLNMTINDNIPLPGGGEKTVERELIPNGANVPVTNENRLIYISRVARYRLQMQSAAQTKAFLKGLSSIIQPSWLSMFNQAELQTLIGGAASSINIDDLRRNTQYGGVYVIGDDQQEHPSVRMFWDVMESMSDEDRRKVLKFVTSTPRAPLLGFGSLNPRFSIRDAGDDENRFPTTSTCVNLLKLPRYRSENMLREKLLYAVNSGAGFDLS